MIIIPHRGLIMGGSLGPWEVVATTNTRTMPSSIASGDIAFFTGIRTKNGSSSGSNSISGWTIISSQGAGGYQNSPIAGYIFYWVGGATLYRVLDGTEGGVTYGDSDWTDVGIIVLRPPKPTVSVSATLASSPPATIQAENSLVLFATSRAYTSSDNSQNSYVPDAGLFDGEAPTASNKFNRSWSYRGTEAGFGVAIIEDGPSVVVSSDGGVNTGDTTIRRVTFS